MSAPSARLSAPLRSPRLRSGKVRPLCSADALTPLAVLCAGYSINRCASRRTIAPREFLARAEDGRLIARVLTRRLLASWFERGLRDGQRFAKGPQGRGGIVYLGGGEL